MRRLALGVVVLALAGCGPENDDGTRSLAGTGGAGGVGGAAVEPIGDPAAEAMLCEDWPDCPPGVWAQGDRDVVVHYGCGAEVVRSPSSGSVLGIMGQRSCGRCYVESDVNGCFAETTDPVDGSHAQVQVFVGRCKAPAATFHLSAGCHPGASIQRPNGDRWMISCTGPEVGGVVCWGDPPAT